MASIPFRLPNGTHVTVGDWIGLVLDQGGPHVEVTSPRTEVDGTYYVIPREFIVKEGRSWVFRGANSSV